MLDSIQSDGIARRPPTVDAPPVAADTFTADDMLGFTTFARGFSAGANTQSQQSADDLDLVP